MFHVVFKNGLGFSIKAGSRKEACEMLMLMLGKRSLPRDVNITEA